MPQRSTCAAATKGNGDPMHASEELTAEQRTDGHRVQITLGSQRSDDTGTAPAHENVFELVDVGVAYGGNPAVTGINMSIASKQITALIGPSGCGKSTLLRCLNRMNDLIPDAAVSGEIRYHGQDLY